MVKSIGMVKTIKIKGIREDEKGTDKERHGEARDGTRKKRQKEREKNEQGRFMRL